MKRALLLVAVLTIGFTAGFIASAALDTDFDDCDELTYLRHTGSL